MIYNYICVDRDGTVRGFRKKPSRFSSSSYESGEKRARDGDIWKVPDDPNDGRDVYDSEIARQITGKVLTWFDDPVRF